MKNLKLTMIALVLCAIPAVAFGQAGSADAVMTSTTCPDPCYVAPLFTGAGGFVAERANEDNAMTMDKDEGAVNFALTCGSTVMTGSASVDDKGIARQTFSMNNGMYCDGYGKIEVDNVKAGGWYWVHDDPNSAVSSLVNIHTLGNSNSVMPTNPGGVMMMAPKGGHGTFVKHEASGRVGILPHVMATPDMAPCGGTANTSNNCVLMASYSVKAETGTGAAAKDIGASVVRGAADTVINLSLGGSGFIVVDATATTNVAYEVSGTGSTATNTIAMPGVTASGTTITVAPSTDARCATTNADRGTPVGVTVTASTASGATGTYTLPGLPTAGVKRSFTVTCPAPAAGATVGQELVPENPFPAN